jgi:hypothetical protein
MKQRNLSHRQAHWTELLADFDLEFEYICGKDNLVANALSHKDLANEAAVTSDSVACIAARLEFKATISDVLKSDIVLGYDVDPFYVFLESVLPLREDCTIVDDLIIIDNRLLIPGTGDLRMRLMEEAHQRLGHLAYSKTITELRRNFFWPKIAQDVLHFVSLCEVCQKTKAPTTSPTGKMFTPEFPRLPLTHITIDFMGPLKSSSHYNMLLTVTC